MGNQADYRQQAKNDAETQAAQANAPATGFPDDNTREYKTTLFNTAADPANPDNPAVDKNNLLIAVYAAFEVAKTNGDTIAQKTFRKAFQACIDADIFPKAGPAAKVVQQTPSPRVRQNLTDQDKTHNPTQNAGPNIGPFPGQKTDKDGNVTHTHQDGSTSRTDKDGKDLPDNRAADPNSDVLRNDQQRRDERQRQEEDTQRNR